MNYYYYCQQLSGFEWLRDCGTPEQKFDAFILMVLGFVIIVGLVGLIAAACSEETTRTPEIDLNAEIDRLRQQTEYEQAQAEYHNAQIKAEMKRSQLTHLEEFRRQHDL